MAKAPELDGAQLWGAQDVREKGSVTDRVERSLGIGLGSGSAAEGPGDAGLRFPASFLDGGQLGVNYEFRSGLVVRAEAMFDWLPNASTTFTATNLRVGTATGTINNRWITTATGKVGFAWDRLLVYGKAGGAWVGGTNNSFAAGGTPVGVSVNSSSGGWTAGAGVEWAFAGNWSARAEYDFIGLQNQSFTMPASVHAFCRRYDQRQ